MAIARFPSFVIDCPDPQALAGFYGEILGWEVQGTTGERDQWVDLQPADGSHCISFQRVEDYRAPDWPGQDRPQQMHLDVQVRDLDAGERAVLKLGVTKTADQPGGSFRVFLDPSGHPFCLCRAQDSERTPEGA
ncbi:VOC family protein [Microbacterium sp. A93]|uniref:VOC family protein n=1 Tax=Microbacterium sp. A93 TaxID=3450716 RepID=UPI003F431900